MEITASREETPDYDQTARLATAAFAPSGIVIDAAHLRWFYETCFQKGASVIALRKDGRKVGHFAMVRQTLVVDGVDVAAAQLVDLFISKEARGRESLKTIYAAVESQFLAEDIRFAIGMPNKKAGPINEHFFNLKPFLTLPIHIGISVPWLSSSKPISLAFDKADSEQMRSILSHFRTDASENGLAWDERSLFERLSGPQFEYGLHLLGDVLIISSPRLFRGVRYAVICCIRVRAQFNGHLAPVLRSLFRAACRMWRTRLYLYVGVNDKVPSLPGVQIPDRLRPSPMVVQIRDFQPAQTPLRLDRYELIDFDFA